MESFKSVFKEIWQLYYDKEVVAQFTMVKVFLPW